MDDESIVYEYPKMNLKNNKLVVYTALFGGYDELHDPKEKFSGCVFLCFTDDVHLKSNIWEIRVVDCDMPPNIMNRRYKMLPHLYLSEYDQSMYVDANIEITGNPLELSEKYLKTNDIAFPRHFLHDCLYKEAQHCIDLCKSGKAETTELVDKYIKEGFPPNYGLAENNILLRKHNLDEIVKTMELWFSIFMQGPHRDQLSLMYLLWKYDIKFGFMSVSARNNTQYFRYMLHNSVKTMSKLNQLKAYISSNRERNRFYKFLIASQDRLKRFRSCIR